MDQMAKPLQMFLKRDGADLQIPGCAPGQQTEVVCKHRCTAAAQVLSDCGGKCAVLCCGLLENQLDRKEQQAAGQAGKKDWLSAQPCLRRSFVPTAMRLQ